MANIDKLVTRLALEATPVKPAPHPYMLSLKWIAAAVLYLSVSLILGGLRPDLAVKFLNPWFATEITLLSGIFIATTLSAALLAFPDLHQKRRLALAPVWLFGLFVFILFFAWLADTPPAPLPVHSMECTMSITFMAILPAFWTLYSLRHYASTHARLTGSVALLSAFSVGAIWLRLHENTDSIIHVIEWHYLPMLVIVVLGMWLGERVMKW